ncbi:MAG: metallophosphoesterase family protein, partial [Armatimonadetes bacterium]|nr:metallophosphoesterase family protein [Armatimonadota bacterium]
MISDTHLDDGGPGPSPGLSQGGGKRLPQQVLDTFRAAGVGLILHCGDLGTSTAVLDHLETVAPVKAVRGYPDPREEGDRLAETVRVLEVEGVRIGMVHDLAWPGPPIRYTTRLEFPPGDLAQTLSMKFGQPVDVVVHGDTHEEDIAWHQGVLFINPGSPTCPGLRHPVGELGTVALLDVYNGVVSAEIIKLRP